MAQADLFPILWRTATHGHPEVRALADRHYSRQSIGAPQIMAPGKRFILLTPCERAVWGALENLDPVGNLRWRCTIFRNEGAGRSSDLIRAATALTFERWRRRFGALPPVPLTTEVDPERVRHKRDPGRCFLRAGWTIVGEARGLIILEAPNGAAEPG